MPSGRALLVLVLLSFHWGHNTDTHTPPQAQKRERAPEDRHHLGSLGDLLAREILGDFLAAQSSLSSMSLESEQLQLSITVEIKLFP